MPKMYSKLFSSSVCISVGYCHGIYEESKECYGLLVPVIGIACLDYESADHSHGLYWVNKPGLHVVKKTLCGHRYGS